LGAGIGTLTHTTLATVSKIGLHRKEDYAFYTVENNEFCLRQLGENLGRFEGLYQVVSTPQEVPIEERKFDLMVIDGGGDLPGDMGLMSVEGMLRKGGVIFVEGNRATQRQLIKEWYGDREYVYVCFRALGPVITYANLVANNKAYHIYKFEPRTLEGLKLRLAEFVNAIFVKLSRKLMRVSSSLISGGNTPLNPN
jgi:hypothetical protein